MKSLTRKSLYGVYPDGFSNNNNNNNNNVLQCTKSVH